MTTRIGFAVALLIVASSVGACGDGGNDSRGTAVVTLDAFSGLPNPTWTLTVAQSDELVSRWEALATTTPTGYPSILGYRGVIVDFYDGSQIWVSTGIAVEEHANSARTDSGRALERWILETGRDTVDTTLLDATLAEISG